MADRPTILFTASFRAPFIDDDLRILRKHFDVRPVIAAGWSVPLRYLRELPEARVTFSWFASVYSSILVSLAKLFGRRTIIVLGGVDLAKEKELSYGIWNSRWKSILVRYGLTHADAVLAVDDSLKREAIQRAQYDGSNITTVPTGYDSEFWKPQGEKKPLVLTVASCPDMARIKLKGIDLFLRVARRLPDTRFRMIGIRPHIAAFLDIPPNVEYFSSIPREMVLPSYQESKVYCQLSYREGLPNALCEAMLCECVPVGSDVGGIPSAIGEAGFLASYNDEVQISETIQRALATPPEHGKKARERIVTHFSLSQREAALRRAVIDLLK